MPEQLTASAVVPTEAPARYAKQLASHLGRRAEIREEADGTRIVLGDASCLLQSRPGSLELAATAELHTDYAKPFVLQLVDVINHFAHVIWVVRILIGGAIHSCAVVVDADQSHVEPVCARHLSQRRQPVHGGAMRADDLSLLRFEDPILPAFRGLGPVSRMLPVQ